MKRLLPLLVVFLVLLFAFHADPLFVNRKVGHGQRPVGAVPKAALHADAATLQVFQQQPDFSFQVLHQQSAPGIGKEDRGDDGVRTRQRLPGDLPGVGGGGHGSPGDNRRAD